MSDWRMEDLKEWDDKIIEIANKFGLNWHPIDYEVCDYFEMIGHMSYHGMPTHYDHWSYGKSFERTHNMYNLGMEGLPYELIINSNPSIAYLMKQNPLYLQILIMAHCVGHSDFFKNNHCFKDTRPDRVIQKFKAASKRIKKYTEDPDIGIDAVEEILDIAHSLKYQTSRYGLDYEILDDDDLLPIKEPQDEVDKLWNDIAKLEIDMFGGSPDPEVFKCKDLLKFLVNCDRLPDWKRDVIDIVRQESLYFMPQIRTKIMNEGWASFWHHKILNELNLPQDLHIPFLKMHNAVVCPHPNRVNPYHLGFYLFTKIYENEGLEKMFEVRECHDDISFLMTFLDQDDMEKLELFSFKRAGDNIVVDDVSDKDGWKKVKTSLLMNTGVNLIPTIYVQRVAKDGSLILSHVYDNRELDLDSADKVKDDLSKLWDGQVKLFTIIEGEQWEI